MTDRTFVKGYFRQGLALQNLGNLDGALEAVKRGLGIDSQNADLKKMSREIEEAQRQKKVESYLVSSEMLLKDNDVSGSFKSCDAGLRLDPENKGLNALMARLKPLHERHEKHRVSNMDPKERLKEEGDNLFKNAKFEEAIKVYTRCIDSMSDKVRIPPRHYFAARFYPYFLICSRRNWL
jgi:tetratricopeptide (TPR) repeat protein